VAIPPLCELSFNEILKRGLTVKGFDNIIHVHIFQRRCMCVMSVCECMCMCMHVCMCFMYVWAVNM